MKYILWSKEIQPRDDGHISLEDLASLMDGNLPVEQRRKFMAHINQCRHCFDTMAQTLKDLSDSSGEINNAVNAFAKDDKKDATPIQPWCGGGRLRQHKIRYTIAASVIFIVMITGALVFKQHNAPPSEILVASLTLDQQFKSVLMENNNLKWNSSERIDRLAGLLRQKGLNIKSVKSVVISAPYYPSKSFLGPVEALEIRIEKGVVYLKVVEK